MTSKDVKELEEMSPAKLASDWARLGLIKVALGSLYRQRREGLLSDANADMLYRLEQLSERVAATAT